MNVIPVNGSPNSKGCTCTALAEVAKTLAEESIETKIFWIGNKSLSGCIGCAKCAETGQCAFDDKVNEFRAAAKHADGFIFGSPVHYASASGTMTAFMDRVFFSDLLGNDNRTFRLKPAAAVVSARRAGTTSTFDQLNKYFTIQEMPVISSVYWNMVHGDTPDDVLQDKEGLWTMRVLARNMAYFLKCKAAGEKSGLQPPAQEEPVFTNFINH
jgi:multimeric flavodoxin WrbA